jgi:hypothetical protein
MTDQSSGTGAAANGAGGGLAALFGEAEAAAEGAA